MILADKIIQLRKKNGWSQEELAEKMNVSRQAVSKWESAQAVPDLQKILALSELFCVTTDYLLRDEIETEQITADEPSDKKTVTLSMAHEYIAIRKKAALMIASATFLCIVSIIPLLILGALADLTNIGISEDTAGIVGLCLLFLINTAAISMYIVCGYRSSHYSFLNDAEFDTEYGVVGMVKEKEKAFKKLYMRLNLIGVILCVLCPLPLILSALANNDLIAAAMTCLLILIAALGVFCFIYVGVRWASLRRLQHDPEYIENDNKKREPSLFDTVRTVYWLIVTAAYFAWSFIGGAWHISWILWIIAGILFAAINAIFNYFENKDA